MKLDLVAGIPFVFRDARDRYVLRRVVEENIYGAPIDTTPWAGRIVIDVGAHIGAFSIMAARAGAKVIAIEPNVDNFRLLQMNIAGNSRASSRIDVTPICAAVALRTGIGRLYLNEADHSGHTLYPNVPGVFQECMTVELLELLQHYKITDVEMMKLDCEGAEYAIIPTILQNPRRFRHLAIEFHPLDDPKNGIIGGQYSWRGELKRYYESRRASDDNDDEFLFSFRG